MKYITNTLKNTIGFTDYLIRGSINAGIYFCIMPTALNKLNEEELFLMGSADKDYTKSQSSGFGLGFLVGAGMCCATAQVIANEIHHQNYMPLLAILTTNTASALIETRKALINRKKFKDLEDKL